MNYKYKNKKMMDSSVIYASGALECPLPRSPNTTTAIAINTPIAAPNAAIDASATVSYTHLTLPTILLV